MDIQQNNAKYLDAAQQGDLAEAGRLVDEAAKRAGRPTSTDARIVVECAENFLDEIGEGKIESVWLIGSRGGQVNPAYPERTGVRPDSDWDYLVVGEGFDEVEAELRERLEDGEKFFGLTLDVPISRRGAHKDIIFSSKAADGGILVYQNPLNGQHPQLRPDGFGPAVILLDEQSQIVPLSKRFECGAKEEETAAMPLTVNLQAAATKEKAPKLSGGVVL